MTSEKYNMVFGILIAVSVISIFGFVNVSLQYVKANNTIKDLELRLDSVADGDTPSYAKKASAPAPTDANPIDVKIGSNDHIRGNENGEITIVEFSDFQCPYCSRFHNTLKEVLEEYPNDVKWVYKHFPLSFHPYAKKAAEASECAGDQGKFNEYNDGLFDNQKLITAEYLPVLAKNLGLNSTKFKACLDSGKYASRVDDDFTYGRSIGVTGTPGAFINGVKMRGAESFDSVKARIDAILK